MQQENVITLEYMDDIQRIADLCNVLYFKGNQVIESSIRARLLPPCQSELWNMMQEHMEDSSGKSRKDIGDEET